jgi:Cu/Ag efflux protein CusF
MNMNARVICTLLTLGAALSLGSARPALADSTASGANEKTAKGVLRSIDQKEKTVELKSFWGTRKFNIGTDCKVTLQGKPDTSLAELRPGQKVQISYERVQGVLVAHQITQENVNFTGYVASIDPPKHTMTIRSHLLDKTFFIADDCKVLLRDKAGAVPDIQPGNYVTVTFETPESVSTAHEIALASVTFKGAMTAIDMNDRTLKAKAMLTAKKFNLADDCQIVVGDKPGAKMSDLKLGDQLIISYDDQKGVNIVNRIEVAGTASENATTAAVQRSKSNDRPTTTAPAY